MLIVQMNDLKSLMIFSDSMALAEYPQLKIHLKMIVRKEILTQSFSFFHKLNPTFSCNIVAREMIEGGAQKLGLRLFNLKNDNSYAIV